MLILEEIIRKCYNAMEFFRIMNYGKIRLVEED